MCQELTDELLRGKDACEKVVSHVLQMGSDTLQMPITLDGQDFVVTCYRAERANDPHAPTLENLTRQPAAPGYASALIRAADRIEAHRKANPLAASCAARIIVEELRNADFDIVQTPVADFLDKTATPQSLRDVLRERMRQDEKWGEQNHDPFIYHAVLSEEHGEYAQAVLHTMFGGPKGGFENMRKEATHVAAVALAIVDCLDRGIWRFSLRHEMYRELSQDLDAMKANVAYLYESRQVLAEGMKAFCGEVETAEEVAGFIAMIEANPEMHPEGPDAAKTTLPGLRALFAYMKGIDIPLAGTVAVVSKADADELTRLRALMSKVASIASEPMQTRDAPNGIAAGVQAAPGVQGDGSLTPPASGYTSGATDCGEPAEPSKTSIAKEIPDPMSSDAAADKGEPDWMKQPRFSGEEYKPPFPGFDALSDKTAAEQAAAVNWPEPFAGYIPAGWTPPNAEPLPD